MRLLRNLVPLTALLISWTAQACTVCDSRNGHQLRAGLFDGHVWHTASLVAAPVPALLMAVVLVHFGLPGFREARVHGAMTEAHRRDLPVDGLSA